MYLEIFSNFLDRSTASPMSKDEVDVAETLLAAEEADDLRERIDEVVTSGAAMAVVRGVTTRVPAISSKQAVEKIDAMVRDEARLKKLEQLLTPNWRALLRIARVAKAEDRSVSAWLRKAALDALEKAERGS